MAENGTRNKALAYGLSTVIIIGCLYFFGIPLLFTGIILLIIADDESGLLAGGASCVVLAVILVIAGIITCYCTVKYSKRADDQRRQNQHGMGVVHAGPVVTGTVMSQGAPAPYSQPPPEYTYTAAPQYLTTGPGMQPPQYPATHPGIQPQYPTQAPPYPDQTQHPKY